MTDRLGSALVSAMLLNDLGFQTNQKSTLQSLLRSTKCEGRKTFFKFIICAGTALRDAIVTGIQMMLSLGELLRKLGTFENYNFVHVVLTDGADNESRSSVLDLQKLFLIIGQVIPAKVLTTHFIGVDMSASDSKELKQITALGLENAYLHQSNDSGLDKIFAKIIASIKEQRQVRLQAMSMGSLQAVRIQQQSNPYLELAIKRYVVLFTLDKSGSMEGSSWNKVCQCVANFMNILGDADLVAGITFNEKVNIITKSIKPRSYSQPKPQLKAIQQQQQKKKKKKCIIF